MDPKGSLPHSHVPATCPNPEPAPCSPRPNFPLSEDPSLYYPPICTWFFHVVSFSQVSPPKTCICLSSPHTRYMPRPFHSSRFNHPNNIGEEYRSLSSSLCSFLHSSVTSSLLGPNILRNILFSNTLSVRSCETRSYAKVCFTLQAATKKTVGYNVEQ